MDLGGSRREAEVRGVQIEKTIQRKYFIKEYIFNKRIRKM